MNKSEGKIISIEFTENLIGNIAGNESAFNVSGKEYKWVDGPDNNGELLDKEYTVVETNRGATRKIWEDNNKKRLTNNGSSSEKYVSSNSQTPTKINFGLIEGGYRFTPTNNKKYQN